MGNYSNIKEAIALAIKANNNGEITGTSLQTVLKGIVNSIGTYATYAGIAKPDTNPGNVDQNVFYLAVEQGTYQNFSNLVVKSPSILFYGPNNYWEAQPIAGNAFDYYSRNSTAFVSDGRLRISISSPAGAKVLVTYNLTTGDPSSLSIDFNDYYLSSTYGKCVSEIIVFITSNYNPSTISLGNMGLSPLSIQGLTSWSIPVKGTLVLQLTRSSSSDGTSDNIMAIPLYLTPSTSSGGTSDSIADGSITTAKLAKQAVTKEKLHQEVLNELYSIADGSITAAKLAKQAVTKEKLHQEVLNELYSTKVLYEGTATATLKNAWEISIGASIASEYRLNYYAEVTLEQLSEDEEIYIGLSDKGTEGIGKFILKVQTGTTRNTPQLLFFEDIPSIEGDMRSFPLYSQDYAVIVFEYNEDLDALVVSSISRPMDEASHSKPGLMSIDDKKRLDALPDVLKTSMPEPEQDVVVYPKSPIGMHSVSGMQGLSIDLFHVKSLNFFKHTIYVTDYTSWDPWFTLIDVGDYEIHCVYWRVFMDGEGYHNTITYPADDHIENPWGSWPDVSELVKIEIEGFSTIIDSDGNTKKRIIVTVTASGEV